MECAVKQMPIPRKSIPSEEVIFPRRVIVGMDGSHNSVDAFDWYMKQVHRQNDYVIIGYCPEMTSSIFTVHHSFVPNNLSAMTDMVNAAHEKAMDVYRMLEDRLKHSGARGCVETLSGSSPGQELVKLAEKQGAGLMVIGCRGHTKARRTLVGSVSHYILHHCHIPVLVHPHIHRGRTASTCSRGSITSIEQEIRI